MGRKILVVDDDQKTRLLLKTYLEKIGPPRYYVTAFLLLTMMSLPIKMLLRWVFNLKYIVFIPEFFFNI